MSSAPRQNIHNELDEAVTATPYAALFLDERTRQLEVLPFIWAGIELRHNARPYTPNSCGIMLAVAGALIKGAGMREHVAPTGFIDMEANHLSADRTWCS